MFQKSTKKGIHNMTVKWILNGNMIVLPATVKISKSVSLIWSYWYGSFRLLLSPPDRNTIFLTYWNSYAMCVRSLRGFFVDDNFPSQMNDKRSIDEFRHSHFINGKYKTKWNVFIPVNGIHRLYLIRI